MLFMRRVLFRHLEFVSYTPDGFEAPLFGNTFQLFSQAFDVDINRAGIAKVIKPPDLVKKLVAREHTVGRGSEMI